MYDPQDALEIDAQPTLDRPMPETDTFRDSAIDAVQALSMQIAREQGGTEHVSFDPGEKGNDDGFDLERSETVHCDPQGFQWYESRRRDGANSPEYDGGYGGY